MTAAVKANLDLTLAILKPHVLKVPYIVQDIRDRLLTNGFFILRTKKSTLSLDEAQEFYKEHEGKFFYHRLVTLMSSSPCYFHVLARSDAIQFWRTLMGPTKVFRTIHTHPSTIRGTHGLTDTRNATHGSDSPMTAEKEIKFFFPDFDFQNWQENESEKFLNGEYVFDSKKFIHIVSNCSNHDRLTTEKI